MAALSELILQIVMYLHASNHVKPQRMKTCMQMRAGRKGHKKNKCQSRKIVLKWFLEVRLNEKFFALRLRQSFASDKNRIEEKRRSVQRDAEKRIIVNGKEVLASHCRFLQLRDAVATLPGTQTKCMHKIYNLR